ncbi:ERF family protein [Candidatus Saccharibacteria bacterium]|nr:ERF family protein [Candidatus Saccharibacteria bacterium]
MRYSESIKNIAKALAEAQAEIQNPVKTAVNKGVQGNPKYATLEDTLADYVRPVLTKHGIAIFQSLSTNDRGQVGVQTTLVHESGEWLESDYIFCSVVIPLSNAGKQILTEGQATGVCITYLRRYSLNAAVGITGDADTDGSYAELEPLTYDTALELELTFGKHKGKTLKELYKTERDYVNWLRDKTEDARIKEAIHLIDERIAEHVQGTNKDWSVTTNA